MTDSKHRAFLASVVLACAFALIALTVHWRLWSSIDWGLLLMLQSWLPRAVDVLFSILSLLGSVEITTLIFLAMVWRARPAQRLSWLVAFALIAIIEIAGKTVIGQSEPASKLSRYVFHIGLPTGYISTNYSFPSGHAARATFLTVLAMNMLAAHPRRPAIVWGYVAILGIASLMLVSRVYLADHWFTDVFGGALLGSACAAFALAWEIKLPDAITRIIQPKHQP